LEALQTTQWPKEKIQKDKQPKYTHKVKNNIPTNISRTTCGPMKFPVIV
jgi:hypothetical protein